MGGFSMKGAGAKEEKSRPRDENKSGKKRIVDASPIADLSLMLNETPGVKTELAFFYNFESRAATQAMLRARGGGRSEPISQEMKAEKAENEQAKKDMNM